MGEALQARVIPHLTCLTGLVLNGVPPTWFMQHISTLTSLQVLSFDAAGECCGSKAWPGEQQ
jgi:hypothetical protein